MKLLSNDYSRRTFLKATSAAAGGLALGGFTWPALAEVEVTDAGSTHSLVRHAWCSLFSTDAMTASAPGFLFSFIQM